MVRTIVVPEDASSHNTCGSKRRLLIQIYGRNHLRETVEYVIV